MTIGLFGPRVIGEDAYRREQAVVAKAAHIYGSRVTGEAAPNADASPPPPPPSSKGFEGDERQEGDAAAGADKYLSVKELESALESNPALVDVFLDQEEQRDLPRSTALVKLEKAELSRPGGPRQPILRRIKTLAGRLGQNADL